MDLQAALPVSFISTWRLVKGHGRGQARIIVEVEARACPLRQLQKTHGGVGVLPYLPPEQHAKLPASAAVRLLFEYPIIFWTACSLNRVAGTGAQQSRSGRRSG
jgi:hypothetical protein